MRFKIAILVVESGVCVCVMPCMHLSCVSSSNSNAKAMPVVAVWSWEINHAYKMFTTVGRHIHVRNSHSVSYTVRMELGSDLGGGVEPPDINSRKLCQNNYNFFFFILRLQC